MMERSHFVVVTAIDGSTLLDQLADELFVGIEDSQMKERPLVTVPKVEIDLLEEQSGDVVVTTPAGVVDCGLAVRVAGRSVCAFPEEDTDNIDLARCGSNVEWGAAVSVRIFGGDGGTLGEEELYHLDIPASTYIGEWCFRVWVNSDVVDDFFVYLDTAFLFIEHEPGEGVMSVPYCPVEALSFDIEVVEQELAILEDEAKGLFWLLTGLAVEYDSLIHNLFYSDITGHGEDYLLDLRIPACSGPEEGTELIRESPGETTNVRGQKVCQAAVGLDEEVYISSLEVVGDGEKDLVGETEEWHGDRDRDGVFSRGFLVATVMVMEVKKGRSQQLGPFQS